MCVCDQEHRDRKDCRIRLINCPARRIFTRKEEKVFFFFFFPLLQLWDAWSCGARKSLRAWLAYKLKTSVAYRGGRHCAICIFTSHMRKHMAAIPLLISASMTYSTKPTVVKVYRYKFKALQGENCFFRGIWG